MIRRVDDAPKLVDPSGSISEGQVGPTNVRTMNQSENWEPSSSRGAHNSQFPLNQRRKSPSSMHSITSGTSRVGRSQKRRSEDQHPSGSETKARPASSD
ncbi:hypothetical protein BC827DRAFT_863263 [Russula dissimulans]|nr:hypothetical protein BC827DRAFT_863263 [Russula dissimulans]